MGSNFITHIPNGAFNNTSLLFLFVASDPRNCCHIVRSSLVGNALTAVSGSLFSAALPIQTLY